MTDLQPPLAGYSLWLEAREEEQRFLQSLVDEMARTYGKRRFEAHATVIGLLEKREIDLEGMRKACREIADRCRGVSTEIIGVGIRESHFQSVFLTVVPSQDLITMNRLARDLFGHHDDPPFMPHWSAVYGDLDRGTKEGIVRAVITKVALPMFVPLQNLVLMNVTGYPDEWKAVERYPVVT